LVDSSYWVVKKPCTLVKNGVREAPVPRSWAITHRFVPGPNGLPLPKEISALPAPCELRVMLVTSIVLPPPGLKRKTRKLTP
jgi:hypothetical protein